MNLKSIAFALSLVAIPLAVSAHGPDKGPNGGQVVDDAGHHVEFTTNGTDIVLYLSDAADKPIGSAKAKGRVVIQDGGRQAIAELGVVEPNILSAKLAAPLTSGAKLAVTIKLGDGHDVKARFVAR